MALPRALHCKTDMWPGALRQTEPQEYLDSLPFWHCNGRVCWLPTRARSSVFVSESSCVYRECHSTIAKYDSLRVVHGGEAVRILFPNQYLRTHSVLCLPDSPSFLRPAPFFRRDGLGTRHENVCIQVQGLQPNSSLWILGNAVKRHAWVVCLLVSTDTAFESRHGVQNALYLWKRLCVWLRTKTAVCVYDSSFSLCSLK